MFRLRWLVPLALVALVGCSPLTVPVESSSSTASFTAPEAPELPENCMHYAGDWPVSFYYNKALTLTEGENSLVLTAQEGEDALAIQLTRSRVLMEDFPEDFDFDLELDQMIQRTEETALEQGTPFQLAQRLYGCGYPASWFQRQLESERWSLTVAHCFLYRQPEALVLESTCTSGLTEQGEEWLLEIALSLRATEDE